MGLRNLVTNNFWWKVAALLLAVGAWAGLSPDEYPIMIRPSGTSIATRELVSHPITITKEASDTREFKVSPSEVDITISSRDEKVLRELDGRDILPRIDLRNFGTNATNVEITVIIPEMEKKGLKLERLQPERVQVELVPD